MSGITATNHIAGLSSGMDTESIVTGLMNANRVPLDKLGQAKTLNGWKTDAYREVNTEIASFRDAMQDLRLQGTFNAQKVTSSDARIDASMAGTSTQMNITISSAELATPAKGSSVSFDTKIVNGSNPIVPNGSADTKISFTLNGTSIEIPETSTYDEAISQINSNSAKTNATVSNVGGSLVFTTIDTGTTNIGTGKTNSISITGFDTTKKLQLNIANGATDATDPLNKFAAGTFVQGSDAISGSITINDTKIMISDNNFTYGGVQFNLKQTIDSPAVISIGADTDKIFDKIKTFVDKYNDLVKSLNDKLGESKNRDYPPLTDAQKKDMKDTDITAWETKAKSGLLANDSTIRQFLTQLRTSMSDTVQTAGINSSFDSLQEIGITTSPNYQDNGKLILDESKLKSLLSSNLSDVQKMFSGNFDTGVLTDTTVTSSTKFKNSGIGVRVYDQIGDTLSRLGVIAGAPGTISINSDLAKEATSLTDRMKVAQTKLDAQEQALWTKFNAMESALQKLNSQSSWLTQQLGQ